MGIINADAYSLTGAIAESGHSISHACLGGQSVNLYVANLNRQIGCETDKSIAGNSECRTEREGVGGDCYQIGGVKWNKNRI